HGSARRFRFAPLVFQNPARCLVRAGDAAKADTIRLEAWQQLVTFHATERAVPPRPHVVHRRDRFLSGASGFHAASFGSARLAGELRIAMAMPWMWRLKPMRCVTRVEWSYLTRRRVVSKVEHLDCSGTPWISFFSWHKM